MNRIAAGALQLASPEVRFLLDKTEGTPTDVEMYQLKETHSLVEEFMLLCMQTILFFRFVLRSHFEVMIGLVNIANISVAKQTLKFFPTFACLRRHPTPPVENYQPLIRVYDHTLFHLIKPCFVVLTRVGRYIMTGVIGSTCHGILT
jgi:exosome complex exonuclease DIS3/RRP44